MKKIILSLMALAVVIPVFAITDISKEEAKYQAKIEKITTRDNYIRVLCEKINVNGEQCVYRVIGQYQNNNIWLLLLLQK